LAGDRVYYLVFDFFNLWGWDGVEDYEISKKYLEMKTPRLEREREREREREN
jgi:hypothetical protein